jgi:hypothetical protein
MRILKIAFLVGFSMLALAGCAGSQGGDDASGDASMKDAPCQECGTRGDIELKISNEKTYREWNKKAYSRMDSSAVWGVFPSLSVKADRPEKCKFCHSYSADALDFDLARVEDSLMVKAFPKMRRELMLPGMRLPDADSAYVDSLSKLLLNSVFADGKKLSDMSPWLERDGVEQDISRELSKDFKNLLNALASRYELRYVSIPVVLNVRMDTDLGKSGGYTWQALWTLWDARYGELVFLVYSEFTAATTSRVAPEKEWAEPFASRLWKMLSTDLSKLENH